MTLQQFLDKLAETPREWKLVLSWRGVKAITDRNGLFPLQSIEPRSNTNDYASSLGMYKPSVMRIIHAADESTKHADYDPKLRARLLKACGI